MHLEKIYYLDSFNIKRYNNNLIIGIHFGVKGKNEKTIFNLTTPFDAIIQKIIK